jgi:hypothetical protein
VFKVIAGLILCCALAVTSVGEVNAAPTAGKLLASGLQGSFGSAIGPDGALYVAEGAAGRISRVDPQTGAITTFASGLPKLNPDVGLGGVMDVAFIGSTAYALVTLVSPDVGGTNVDGIYRIDGPDSFTVIADIGQYSLDHPPVPAFFVPTGLQFAFERFQDGFLVTDGHHNRVLQVTLDGKVSEFIAFDNIVPTGLSVEGSTVYIAEAGPVPHLPENGKVVAVKQGSSTAEEVASGASLVVDVERGYAGRIYALSEGPGVPDAPAGSPAQPNSGSLVEVSADGTLPVLVDALDLPSSLEFVGDTAYVVTLTGQVWKIDNVSKLPQITKPVVTPPSAGDGGLLETASGNLDALWLIAIVAVGFAAFASRRRPAGSAQR